MPGKEASIDEEIAKEVNEHIWKPFKKAFENRDWRSFNDLHTDDVLRVSKWGGIKVGQTYKDAVMNAYQKNTSQTRKIDFWLEHRIYDGDIGYEVGYYRLARDQPEKEQVISYARFHIVLKKIDGKWKIAQDWDINNINGVPVTAEDFAKGTPLPL